MNVTCTVQDSRLLPGQDKHNPAAEAVKITTTGAFMRLPHDGQPTSPAAQNKADHGVLFLGLLYLSRALYILQTPRGESSLACFHTSPINSPQQMKRLKAFHLRTCFAFLKASQSGPIYPESTKEDALWKMTVFLSRLCDLKVGETETGRLV